MTKDEFEALIENALQVHPGVTREEAEEMLAHLRDPAPDAAWIAGLSDDEWPIGMRPDGTMNLITVQEHAALGEAGFWDPEVGWHGERPPPPLTPELRAVIDP